MKKLEKETLEVIKDTVQVTPALAIEWLSKNGVNRRLSERQVKQYTNDMINGKWIDNGNPIKFSATGALMDGQHRLKAIIAANMTVEMDVVFNLPAEAFHTIDIGRSRTAADILYIAGEQYSSQLATTLRLLYYWNLTAGDMKTMHAFRNRNGSATVATLEELLKKSPGIRDSVVFAHQCQQAKVLSTSVAAVMHYIFSHIDRDMADDFFTKLAKGNDLVEGNPILVLRNRLMRRDQVGARGDTDQVRKMGLVIKAWNKYISGVKIANLNYDPDDDFPKIEK